MFKALTHNDWVELPLCRSGMFLNTSCLLGLPVWLPGASSWPLCKDGLSFVRFSRALMFFCIQILLCISMAEQTFIYLDFKEAKSFSCAIKLALFGYL